MTREFRNVGYELSDEQQVLAILRLLPKQIWGHMKLVLTHNEKIKTFDNAVSHLKLEAGRREFECAQQVTLVAHANQHTPHKSKNWHKPTNA
ncbi:UNVERIFIED_CONTAM: hypothetical protein Sangu_1193400 [Sesamum angustifolium]|uniref:Uncharacterized protein n=1 Tax=Sesamum angustifolium TaxID=2727405 RepID=A0AAW2NJS4_9LAMI